MGKYLIKRAFMALLTVITVSIITFSVMHAAPGDPWLSEKTPPQSVIDALNEKYGLDQPLPVQYLIYMGNLVQGDMGDSIKVSKNRPVLDMVMEKFPVSAALGVIAVAVATLVGVPLGCLAAYKRGKFTDSFLRVVCTLGVSLPSFVVATVLMLLFCGGIEEWHFFPNTFSWDNGISGFIVPVFCLALYPTCYIARLTRSSMLDAVNQEYIKTARAKGLKTGRTIFTHALRNALIPVITYLGPLTAFTLCGGFVVETVFNIPGLGRSFVQSVQALDYPLILGTSIFLASFIVIMNLLVDILYTVVDPRINLARGT